MTPLSFPPNGLQKSLVAGAARVSGWILGRCWHRSCASVVVDVSNAPSWEDTAVMKFFETSTRNLLAYEAAAGVRHHVALSVVGSERMLESGYFRAKIAQENLIKGFLYPLLDCPRDAVFRIRQGHRGFFHGRQQGTPAICAHSADGGRRCRQRGRPDRDGLTGEWHR